MPSTLDVSALEEAVARTVERVKMLSAETKDLKKELTATKRRLTTTEKKLKKAKSEGQNGDRAGAGVIEEVRPRLQKLEADLQSLLEA